MVCGIEPPLAQSIEVRFNLLLALHRVGIYQELAAKLSVGGLCRAGNGFIAIVGHYVYFFKVTLSM